MAAIRTIWVVNLLWMRTKFSNKLAWNQMENLYTATLTFNSSSSLVTYKLTRDLKEMLLLVIMLSTPILLSLWTLGKCSTCKTSSDRKCTTNCLPCSIKCKVFNLLSTKTNSNLGRQLRLTQVVKTLSKEIILIAL